MRNYKYYVGEQSPQGEQSPFASVISIANIIGVNFKTQLRVHSTWRMTGIPSSSLSPLVALSIEV